MYHQAVPDQTQWSPACAWGHAVSDDLVFWEEEALALVPGEEELGCWSGSVIDDCAGATRAFYTRVVPDELELGSIAVARGDPAGSLAFGAGVLTIGGPPDGIGVAAFRDPFVWRDQEGWKLIVGAGTADGAGAVLHYRSRDLERWEYTGVLSHGCVAIEGSRQVWECPQMIEVDGTWVLVVSVGVNGRGGYVMAACGTYDGDRFCAGDWRRLAFGTAPYATSVFRDSHSRPCMISWLQEEGAVLECGWAGAESLLSELAIDSAGWVTVTPHVSLSNSKLFARLAPATSSWVLDASELARRRATHLSIPDAERVEVDISTAGGPIARVTRASRHQGLVIDRLGRAPDVLPCPADGRIELFLDADILEIFGGGFYGAWRLPGPAELRPMSD